MQFRRQFIKSFLTSVTWWLGVLISLGLYQLAVQLVENKGMAQFDYQTNNARLAIEARLRSYVDVLRATRAMFYGSLIVTPQEFRTYVAELRLPESFPGINNLNFAPLVLDSDKALFERSLRTADSVDTTRFSQFSIKPPGTRPDYHVINYLEPLEGNQASLGFDLASNPQGREALALSRDSDEVISSGRLIRIDGQKIIGIALRLPLYRQGMPHETVMERRAAYYGSVGAGFDVGKLMLDAANKYAVPHLRLKLYDLGRADEHVPAGTSDLEKLLFDNIAHLERGSTNPETGMNQNRYVKRAAMTVGSRLWEIEFSTPKEAMQSGVDNYLPWLVLISAMLGSLLVYCNQYSLLTARTRAIEIANDMTKDLRSSQEDLAEAQQMAKLGSWMLDPDAKSMAWSDETFRIFGMDCTEENPGYQAFLMKIDAQDRQRIQEGLKISISTSEEFNTEHRILRKDGTIRWVQTITRPAQHGHKRILRGTIRDVTERKQTVEALKRSQELLRELTAYQDRIKEDERKRIAREIHDELGQTLLAMRLDVSMLDTRTAKSHPKINDRVRAVLRHIDATVKTVRTIINNLRPAVLDLGLTAAVEWQVEEFRRRTKISCDLIVNPKEITLSDERATTLFRMLQESLANIIRHANATKIRVELYENAGNLIMKISDNGVGINLDDRNKADSFGLVGIEERVLALDGQFVIDSMAGTGTTLTITIPPEKSADAAPVPG